MAEARRDGTRHGNSGMLPRKASILPSATRCAAEIPAKMRQKQYNVWIGHKKAAAKQRLSFTTSTRQ